MKSKVAWVAVHGVRPPACNHAVRNMVTRTESTGPGTNYHTLDCRKCGVRKSYRVSQGGTYRLIRSFAIKKVKVTS